MSLNTIELPGIVVAELYRNSLLASEPSSQPASHEAATAPQPTKTVPAKIAPVAAETPPAALYKFLGKNGRKITLIVNSPGAAYLPDEQLAFLSKMLEACKMNMGDVALVNHASAPVVIASLKSQLQPSVLVLFGVEPVEIHLPVSFPQYKIQSYDHCDFLYSASLEELVQPTDEGKLLKSKLWVSLKTLFNI